ncbi:molybdopterin biosynthesis protein [Halovenus marina]|uniref:molybdopterin biosynthesis protein n=1 Tax=Halovenus marina TaxID=3396621 RepID=UPI003F545CFD
MRKEFRDLTPPDAARELVDAFDLDTGIEHVPLEAAHGHVLAERIDAAIDVPGFDRSNVDGYAVRARDTFGVDETAPATLTVVETIDAGVRPDVTIESGQAAQVATGAVVPEGADAVVMVERTERDGETVLVRTAVAPGEGVMIAGSDVAAGDLALGPGTRLTPREIGLLSATGVDEIPVRQPPRVAVISTGDELVSPGESIDSDAGEIYDVNSYTIGTSVAETGCESVYYQHVDDGAEIARTLTDAAQECDLVLTSGSTSAGATDQIYRLVEEHGELQCHGVAVKPGKPMLVGRFDGTPFVGLPGFPVSALTIFRVFVAPTLRAAAGQPQTQRGSLTGTMARTVRYREGRTRFLPVGLVTDGSEPLVYPVDKGSGATTSLVEADGVVEIPPDIEQIDADDRVEVTLFGSTTPPALLGVGEADPLIARLLDGVERPRYLSVGSREGVRWLRDGIPDVAVVAGPRDYDIEVVELGRWSRRWGLVVPESNPEHVSGLADLVDRDLRFVNRPEGSGLRASLDAKIESVADRRGVSVDEVTDAIEGFGLTARGYESPPRRVLDRTADLGLGLEATARELGLGFVPVDTQSVSVLGNPDRIDKAAVADFRSLFPLEEGVCDGLVGFEAE